MLCLLCSSTFLSAFQGFAMAPVALSLMWSAALLILFAVSHVRLQCDSGALFMAQCSGVDQRRCTFDIILLQTAALGVHEIYTRRAGKRVPSPL